MNFAPPEPGGLALGAWGAVQASAAGVAIALGGVIRDVVAICLIHQAFGPATPYTSVYALEVVLLIAAIIVMIPLLRRAPNRSPRPEYPLRNHAPTGPRDTAGLVARRRPPHIDACSA